MAEPEKASLKLNSGAPPESPTTARPVDFDDDIDEPTTSAALADESSTTAPKTTEEVPPPKPPRPVSPRQQAEATLQEAFPSIDAAVVKAVLTASGGQVEPAFNALLGMTDPDSFREPPEPPAKPPRPTAPPPAVQSQLEADERYARQLAEHYGSAGRRGAPRGQGQQQRPEEREHSFFDDDLPVIRENLRKGFLETQSTVNKFFQDFKKKLDGDDADDFNQQPPRPAQGFAGQRSGPGGSQIYGRRSGDAARRSADRERYDADPQVLGDDFSTLELRDHDAPPPQPRRPLANPDLFKPTPSPPAGRRVAFQDSPSDDFQSDMYGSGDLPKRTTSAGKSSKWQPLSTVEPSPVAENDPFSLGDSDDDKDAKGKDHDETERLQKATAEAMSDDISGKDEASKPSTKS